MCARHHPHNNTKDISVMQQSALELMADSVLVNMEPIKRSTNLKRLAPSLPSPITPLDNNNKRRRTVQQCSPRRVSSSSSCLELPTARLPSEGLGLHSPKVRFSTVRVHTIPSDKDSNSSLSEQNDPETTSRTEQKEQTTTTTRANESSLTVDEFEQQRRHPSTLRRHRQTQKEATEKERPTVSAETAFRRARFLAQSQQHVRNSNPHRVSLSLDE